MVSAKPSEHSKAEPLSPQANQEGEIADVRTGYGEELQIDHTPIIPKLINMSVFVFTYIQNKVPRAA